VLAAQSLGGWSVVLVIAQNNVGTEFRLDHLQQVNEEGDVFRLLAHIPGDTQEIGMEPLQSAFLGAKQALVAAPHVQVADMDNRKVPRPRGRHRDPMALEDRAVGFAQNGISECAQRDERHDHDQRQQEHGGRIMESQRESKVVLD
jgi:hypothetical protein